ncbi:hypothetical protein [Paraflavitalea speifideaquila]|uniref:hypothetical protein n=1 Tax=Paraflavitalea speifideaquila TaxID=3076558 RepID=UPI0028EC5B83|nr:hypothetical protein [Paraflavitalea speifideiaquila]
MGNEPVQYGLDDLNGFQINGNDSFLRAIVSKDMLLVKPSDPTELPDPDVVDENKQEIDTVFLRIIIKGPKVSLYELVDTKSHFYISEQPGDYQELQYKVYYSRKLSSIQRRPIFQDQLRTYIRGHIQEGRLLRLLDRAGYEEDDLLPLIAGINQVPVKGKHKKNLNFCGSRTCLFYYECRRKYCIGYFGL